MPSFYYASVGMHVLSVHSSCLYVLTFQSVNCVCVLWCLLVGCFYVYNICLCCLFVDCCCEVVDARPIDTQCFITLVAIVIVPITLEIY